ncbi:precorrin-3B synthase [Leptolyngbya sp. 'hensonii']|nr:precorrin-3B synthase [Leptolyngbya sp. 'hensonii']
MRCTGKRKPLLHESSSQSSVSACPGLFYHTPALDGTLLRVRIPGGLLNSLQSQVLADLATDYGDGHLYVTNRANLQIRAVETRLPPDRLQELQRFGLAARDPDLDPLRNIMTSPTAGIDPTERYDTRFLVSILDEYIQSRPDWAGLPPKFSVCFDGGGTVSVADRPNDISLVAIESSAGVLFRLRLGGEAGQLWDTGLLLQPEHCILMVIAISELYLEYIQHGGWRQDLALGRRVKVRRPRLRHLITAWGREQFLERAIEGSTVPVIRTIPTPLPCASTPSAHLGAHPQRQPEFSYLGIVLPLGQLSSGQMRELAALSETYGSGTLRLTPWQNLLIGDLPTEQVAQVRTEIAQMGLDCSPENYYGALMACPGRLGCAAAATDTPSHAVALAQYLQPRLSPPQPVSIHFSGCEKSCAQSLSSDITLLGTPLAGEEGSEGYDIYIQGHSNRETRFGHLLHEAIPAHQVPQVVEEILRNNPFDGQDNR